MKAKETEIKEKEEFNEDDFYEEPYYTYYRPNKNYPINVSGNELKEMSKEACEYIFKLGSKGKKNIDIKSLNTVRALLFCIKETMYSILEDTAKDITDEKPDYIPDKVFDVGAVVQIPSSEGYPKKDGVIVGVKKKKNEPVYDLFLGHTTLSNLSEDALLDMIGLVDYGMYYKNEDNEKIPVDSKFKLGDSVVFKITEKMRNPFDVKHIESDFKRGIISYVGLKGKIPVYSIETEEEVYGGIEEPELINMIKNYAEEAK